MTAFERALKFTLRWEGGFSDNPADPGGRTDHGIAETFHPEAWADGKVTPEEAADIYRTSYWDAVEGDRLPEDLAVAMFESAVNPGVTASIMFLQAALGVGVDGVAGVKTWLALEKANEPLAQRVADMRTGYFIAKGMRGSKRVFLRGWMNRCRDLWRELRN